MRLGIDGSNLRQGGGITHLVQLLEVADPATAGFECVTVWGAGHLLQQLPDRPWLVRARELALEARGPTRWWWQQHTLRRLAVRSADVLFSPGGTYLGGFHPFVAMFRNMLPFDSAERRAYGVSRMRMKLEALRAAQRVTFQRADGVIFLTDYARSRLAQEGVILRSPCAVIPHGLDERFFLPAQPQRPLQEYSSSVPYRWLYVSAVHRYKHPWSVAEAVAALRTEGYPVSLDIVGPAYPPALERLNATLRRLDPAGGFMRVNPAKPHDDLPRVYGGADAFVFASTCENMPNSLLEAMAAGLPIVCSDRPPMPDILQDGGEYADPERPETMADAMRRLMNDPGLRTRLVEAAQRRAREYSWARCARHTLEFLSRTAGTYAGISRT